MNKRGLLRALGITCHMILSLSTLLLLSVTSHASRQLENPNKEALTKSHSKENFDTLVSLSSASYTTGPLEKPQQAPVRLLTKPQEPPTGRLWKKSLLSLPFAFSTLRVRSGKRRSNEKIPRIKAVPALLAHKKIENDLENTSKGAFYKSELTGFGQRKSGLRLERDLKSLLRENFDHVHKSNKNSVSRLEKGLGRGTDAKVHLRDKNKEDVFFLYFSRDKGLEDSNNMKVDREQNQEMKRKGFETFDTRFARRAIEQVANDNGRVSPRDEGKSDKVDKLEVGGKEGKVVEDHAEVDNEEVKAKPDKVFKNSLEGGDKTAPGIWLRKYYRRLG